MLTIEKRTARRLVLGLVLSCVLSGCAPPGARALLEGKRLIDRRKYDRAVEQLQLATSLLPTNAQAWNYLGLAYHGAGRATNALAAYQKALTLDPGLAEARYNLGCLWLQQGRAELRARELAAAEKSFR